jgi:hypothetical protein
MLITLGTINSSNYSGSNFIFGTNSATPVGTDYPDTILQDSSDVTYYNVNGSAVNDVSQGANFQPFTTIYAGNGTINSVNALLRLRNDPSVCGASPTTEVWAAINGEFEEFIATASLTSDFADYSINFPVVPNYGMTWPASGSLGFHVIASMLVGIRNRTNCSGGTNKQTQFSAASMLVDYSFPSPTLTLGSLGSVGVGQAELSGTVTANQNVLAFWAPVQWRFEVATTSGGPWFAVDAYQGEVVGTTPVSVTSTVNLIGADPLHPKSTYYYSLVGLCDGVTTRSAVGSFTTPGVDPSFGAF